MMLKDDSYNQPQASTVQALNAEVPKLTQKDEYSCKSLRHIHMEQDFKKIRFIQMQKIVSVFLIWRGQGFNIVGMRL